MFIVSIAVATQIYCEVAVRSLWVAEIGGTVSSTCGHVAAVVRLRAASDTPTLRSGAGRYSFALRYLSLPF